MPAAAPTRHTVATVDEIPPGGRKIVEVGGRSIGVFNIGGEYFALRNRCPHQGGPLCRGRLSGLLEADAPGAYQFSRRGEILRCPWHGWEFDLRTGRSHLDPDRVRTRSYTVEVRGGADSGADTGPAVPPPPATELVAETYPVETERRAVVVVLPS